MSNYGHSIELLKNVTVCDPAAGSGAFPVGMMQVLNEIIENLQNRHITPDELKEEDDFDRKKAIIANSLYGVEVKRWAVWINQLRLWLSLFVDIPAEKDDEFKNSVIPLLPNLQFKIRTGDSVVQRIGERLFPVKEHVQELSASIKTKITNLKKEKIDFFYNRSGIAKDILSKENAIFKEIIDQQIEDKQKELIRLKRPKVEQKTFFESPGKQKEFEFSDNRIEQLNEEIQNLIEEKKAFKDEHPLIWSIEFAEIFYDKKGFDIIIGNPPYVRQEEISDPNAIMEQKVYKSYLQESIRKDFSKHFLKKEKISGKSDLYTYFYIKSLRLLNKNGIHTFICSNSWLDVEYGVWLQKFLLFNCHVHFVIDNHARRSFSSADVNTIISVIDAPIENRNLWNPQNKYKFIAFKKSFDEVLFTENLLQIEEQNNRIINVSYFRSFSIEVEKLIEDGSEYVNEQDRMQKQGTYIGNKWGSKYLYSPDIYFEIKKRGAEKIHELGSLLSYTQRNSLEIFESCQESAVKTNNTIPFLNSSKQINKIHIDPNEIKNFIDLSKSKLKNKSLKYKIPDLISNRFIGERVFFIEGDNYIVGDTFFIGEFKNKDKKDYYLGCLNSTLTILNVLLIGRKNMGDGVLLFYGPELKKLELFLPENKEDIISSYKSMRSRIIQDVYTEIGFKKDIDIRIQLPNPISDRKMIDEVIFNELGLNDNEKNEIYWVVGELIKQRASKAGSKKTI